MGLASSTSAQARANALHRTPIDVFATLYRHLKEQRTRTLELFKELDRDQTAYLEKKVKYVRTVLDFNTDGKLSFQELHSAIEDCYRVGEVLRAPEGKRVVLEIVRRLRAHLRDAKDHKAAFRALDFNRDGVLDHAEVVRTLRLLLPDITNNELRYVLGKLYLADPDGDGNISLAEVRQILEVADADVEALLDGIDASGDRLRAGLPPPQVPSATPAPFGAGLAGSLVSPGGTGFNGAGASAGGEALGDVKVGGDFETGYGLVKVAEFLRAAAAREEKRLSEVGVDAEQEQRNVQEDVLKKLEKLMQLFREQNRVESFIRELSGTIAGVDAEARRLASLVASAFESFATLLKERENEMLAAIQSQKEDKERLLYEQRERSEKLGFDMKAAIELAENALRDRDPHSFLEKSKQFAAMIAGIETRGAEIGSGPATSTTFSLTLDVANASERLRTALAFEEERAAAAALASDDGTAAAAAANLADPAVAVLRRVYDSAASASGGVGAVGVQASALLTALRTDADASKVVVLSAAENVLHSLGFASLLFEHFCAVLGVGSPAAEYAKQIRMEMERKLGANQSNSSESYWRERAEAAEEKMEKEKRQHEKALDRLKAETERKQREFETRLQAALERSEDLFAQQRMSGDGPPQGYGSPTSLGRRMPPSAGYGGAQARPMSAVRSSRTSAPMYNGRTSTRMSPSTGGESRLAMTGARMNVMH